MFHIDFETHVGQTCIGKEIVLGISQLWESRNEDDWRRALASYWDNPSVRTNFTIEEFMNKLDAEAIRRSDVEGWLTFLREYFHWKFTGTYLGQRLADLESNEPERLFRVKELLFASDLSNIRRALERARYIKGLGPAGASGLLAILFPQWFGTVDRFVVQSLLEIQELPERHKLLRMAPKSLTDDDAVALIGILQQKASQLNGLFRTNEWTPRKIDMILWTLRNSPSCP